MSEVGNRANATNEGTRGFLFADLRGYTAYVERAGNAAAADLLQRYRSLVRDQVARHDGAEIRTEGDSFYVVFPTASAAVRCGLALVEAARRATEDHPRAPLAVAVGVHAGEAVGTDEGYVGSAVNLAARVCAVARSGEVLVTETVRGLTRGSLSVGFADRGRHRLKGIPERVMLYAVRPAERDVMPRGGRVPVARLLAAGALAAAVVAGLAVALPAFDRGAPGASGGPSLTSALETTTSATATATAQPVPVVGDELVFVPLDPGRYVLRRFQPRVGFEVSERGWGITTDLVAVFDVAYSPSGRLEGIEGSISGSVIDVVFSASCLDTGAETLESSTEALIAWFEGHPHLEVTDPAPVAVGGHRGIEFEIAPKPLDMASGCVPPDTPPEEALLYLFPLAEGRIYRLGPSERARVVTIDVPDGPVTLFVAPTDPRRFEPFIERSARVIESIGFEP